VIILNCSLVLVPICHIESSIALFGHTHVTTEFNQTFHIFITKFAGFPAITHFITTGTFIDGINDLVNTDSFSAAAFPAHKYFDGTAIEASVVAISHGLYKI